MKLLLAGGRSFFLLTKSFRLLITKDILQILINPPPTFINNLNLDTVFKVAWANFMKLGKFTYTANKKADLLFKDLHLTRSDIIFSKHDQYAILRLKHNKTNTNHTKIRIMLAVTRDSTCPVTALRFLFTHNPQSPHALLFAFNNCLFPQQHIVDNFQAWLLTRKISSIGFLGHSFKRVIIQQIVYLMKIFKS